MIGFPSEGLLFGITFVVAYQSMLMVFVCYPSIEFSTTSSRRHLYSNYPIVFIAVNFKDS